MASLHLAKFIPYSPRERLIEVSNQSWNTYQDPSLAPMNGNLPQNLWSKELKHPEVKGVGSRFRRKAHNHIHSEHMGVGSATYRISV